jgi:uncharacterized repeat protein (TIGR01451 family)
MRSATRRWLSVLSTVAVSVGLVLGAGVAPAAAAGPAQLQLEITPVDPATGQVITDTAFGQHNNRIAYRVSYSCSVAECTNAVVTLPAIDLDPTYGTYRLLAYENWTPPPGGGASITQNVTTGITVSLGNVAAGVASAFTIQYLRAIDTSAPNPVPAAFFPDGYQITRSATITSPNAVAPVTATASPVTWHTQIPTPAIVKSGATSVRAGEETTYTIAMSDGCFENLGQGRWVATGRYLCGESYTVVDRLPAQAEFVGASGGGVYNAATRTITWTGSGAGAAGGWGVAATDGWTTNGARGYYPRTVTVRYPAANFPEGANDADFIVPVTNNVDVSVTYLDAAATTRTASASTTGDVFRVRPFGRSTQTKSSTADATVGNERYVNVNPDTTGIICPAGGRDEWNRSCTPGQPVSPFPPRTDNYWAIDTYNGGNVPGVATVVDDDLDSTSLRVRQVTTSATTPAPTIEWTITDGTTTTSGTTVGTSYTAPAGSRLKAVRVTSGAIAGPNVLPSGTANTPFRVNLLYDVPAGATIQRWTNSATGTMSYPQNPEIAPIAVNSSGTINFRALPKSAVTPPSFTAAFAGAPVIEGGGQVVPGGKVTFNVRGSTATIPADRDVSPQYVFLAPAGWAIAPNSASFAAGTVPAGVAFTYKTVTVAGVQRQAVIASWPTGATFGKNVTWPTMSVVASPTFAVAAGTQSSAAMWAGDSRNVYPQSGATYTGQVIDATDVDGDGSTTEAFASVNYTVPVSSSPGLEVIKEICVPASAGCDWVSDPNIVVGVSPNASNITYRVTLRNSGNTTLTNVVGYDVLPYANDPRGSNFSETLNTVTGTSANLALTFSPSSNPCRAEVLPANTGCSADWSAAAAGSRSIRAGVTGAMAPGATASFTFTANVVAGASADAVACNSVAVDSASTVPSEPRPVCATTQEADLRITVPDRLPLQAGRPGVVPFTVTNLGGSQTAPASVNIKVPEGIRITSLTPAGWSCVASDTQADGSVLGEVTLTCVPVTATGQQRSLARNVPEALNLPAVIPSDTIVGEETCFPASVSGLMSDPVRSNNDASACFTVAAGDALVGLTKDDGVDEVRIGDQITYSIDVSNLLAGEALTDLVVTDVLPSTVAFVSASDGGTVSGQGEPDAAGALPGGTVSWNLASLAAAGRADADGDVATGAPGSQRTVTVTVRVIQAAEATDAIANEASVLVSDPASPDTALTDTDGDTDSLLRTASIQLLKSVDRTTVSAVGETIGYSFLVTNSGDVTLTNVDITEVEFTGAGDPLEVVCPASATSLAPKATVTCTASYAVTQADLDGGVVSNTATATGTAPAGLTAPTSAQSTAAVTAQVSSALTLEKTVTPSTATEAGDDVTYGFEVTNTGDVTVSDVEIVEGEFTGDAAQLSDVECETTGPLAPDASVSCSATYTLTQDDVDAGTVSNTATASADAPGAVTDPASAASTAVLSIPAAPALAVVKSVSGATVDSAGDVVTYLFDVTNTGNVTVDGIAIEERTFTGAGQPVAVTCPPATLAPGDETTCVGTYTVVQADVDAGGIDNTARVTGLAPNDAPVVSADSTVNLPIAADPSVALVKSASPTTLLVGQETTYSFVVTNTGNVTLSDVAIDETEFTGSGDLSDVTCVGASALAPGAQAICSATYTITQTDVDAGQLTNTATALAGSRGGDVSSEESTVRLPFDADPGLSIVKTADTAGFTTAGDEIEYRFHVTNTGNVTMTDVAVAEGEFTGTGELADMSCAPASLLPGQFLDCSATYTVTQADVDAGELSNSATASGLAPRATDPSTSDPSEVTVPFVGASGLLLAKAGTGVDVNRDGLVTARDAIRWTFVATNTGAATLTQLAISDPLAGTVTCEATVLPPGASVACAAGDYAITSQDAATGRVVNTATATALGAAGVAVTSAEASATVQVDAEPPLAATGGQLALWIVVLAAILLLGGAAALGRSRLRRRDTF